MVRIFARIGSMLSVVMVVAAGAVGVASAAPSNFTVNVNHSSGTLAMAISGNLSWSTSLRTVTFSNMQLYVRSGEHATVTWQAYQGDTLVDSLILEDGFSGPVVNSSLTSGPGGIQRVIVRVYDVDHVINEYAHCYQTASVCQYS